jgi:5-methylcytosine-specific restriction endonuclease McrA
MAQRGKGPGGPNRGPSQELIDAVWNKGTHIRGQNPDVHRRDVFGNPLYKPSFGKQGEKSWQIDHKKPIAKGGTDDLRNLQPLQTAVNQEKGDKYPFKPKP